MQAHPSDDGVALIRAEGISKYYRVTKGTMYRKTLGTVKAVDGISFAVPEGETYSLVGE